MRRVYVLSLLWAGGTARTGAEDPQEYAGVQALSQGLHQSGPASAQEARAAGNRAPARSLRVAGVLTHSVAPASGTEWKDRGPLEPRAAPGAGRGRRAALSYKAGCASQGS